MGIEMIKLSGKTETPALREQDLPKVSFSVHSVPNLAMSIWLMSMPAGQPPFPWWSYSAEMDEDVNKLASMTGVSSPQGLFDLLFLLQIRKSFPNGLYALVPGNVKTEGWNNLADTAKASIQRGQSCVYRLEAALGKKLAVNWVPFYQPQVIVKDTSGDNIIRFFNAAKSDDVANSLSFISVDDVRKMPEIVSLLVQTDEKRSEKMVNIADWFGVYSSPLNDKHGTCALTYTNSTKALAAFADFSKQLTAAVDTVRKALLAEPSPATVIKLLSRVIAL